MKATAETTDAVPNLKHAGEFRQLAAIRKQREADNNRYPWWCGIVSSALGYSVGSDGRLTPRNDEKKERQSLCAD